MMRVHFSKRPPSLNGLWTNVPGRGRVLNGRYLKWRGSVHITPKDVADTSFPIRHRVKVEYFLERPDVKIVDVANYEKALSDGLVRTNILWDDHLIWDVRTAWSTDKSLHPVTAFIFPLPDGW